MKPLQEAWASALGAGRGLLLATLAGAGLLAWPGPAAAADAAAAAASAPTPTAEAPFDLADPARIAAGKKRFGSTCAAYCHGSEGEGGKTPKFKGRADFSPADAHRTITEGRRGTDVMPPWGNVFTPLQIWELVAYLQFLAAQPAAAPAQ